MFRKYFFTLLVVTSTLCSNLFADKSVPESAITDIGKQLIRQSQWIGDQYAEYTVNGEWHFGSKIGWLSGFIGGEYWIQYELTGDEQFKKLALARADMLLKDAGIDRTHDMGFIFLPTVASAFKKTGAEKYRIAGLLAAEMLSRRFNENGKFIRAWGKLGEPKKSGWMIIDTMMNLELLFWAAMESGNSKYYEIAYKHALTTLDETIRANASSYHVVEFNPQTGEVEKKRTHQGNADESTWGRGQAWEIYVLTKADGMVRKLVGDSVATAINRIPTGQPEGFALIQNYPNPFNPITTLCYDLPEDAMVNITIYDMMGRNIKTMVNQNQNSGYKSIQWDATNNVGQPVSAGVYLYNIQAGKFRKTKKMVVLK